MKIVDLNVEYDRLKIAQQTNESLLKNNQTKSFELFSMDENVFKFRFNQTIDSMIEISEGGDKEVIENDIQNSADEIYLKIYTIITTENNEPISGNIKIQERVRIYPRTYSWESNDENYFHISHLGISIEDGVIPDVRVIGFLENNSQTTICFTQPFGCIPFSKLSDPFDSRKNYQTAINYRFNQQLFLLGFGTDGVEYKIYPDQFLFYYPEVNANARNIAPGDSVYTFDLHGYDYSCPLFREATSKIFSYRIYSDPVGFDDDQPNGLVQFEVSKKND